MYLQYNRRQEGQVHYLILTWYDMNVQSWICVIWSLKWDKQATRGGALLFDTQTITWYDTNVQSWIYFDL